MTITEILHKRVLVGERGNYHSSTQTVKELKILEISPSGNWVKVLNDAGQKYWLHTTDINVIEVLESIQVNGVNNK